MPGFSNVSVARKPFVPAKKQFSRVFSLAHVLSKDETKNSHIAHSPGTAVFSLCNGKINRVFSSRFSAALSFVEGRKKGGRKKSEAKERGERGKNAARKEREPRVSSGFHASIQGNAAFRNGGKGFC